MLTNNCKITTMKLLDSAMNQHFKHVCSMVITYPGCSHTSFAQLNAVENEIQLWLAVRKLNTKVVKLSCHWKLRNTTIIDFNSFQCTMM